MTPQLWIGLLFSAFLVGFLIVAFFRRPNVTHSQHTTLRFFSSLCAGFAAWFLTGAALIELVKVLSSGGKLAFTGTAGFALFALVWATYPSHREHSPLPAPDKEDAPNPL